MKKKAKQIKEKSADYCSMFCSISCCNAHNTVIDGVAFGANYSPYDEEGKEEDRPSSCTTHYTAVDNDFWASNGKETEEK